MNIPTITEEDLGTFRLKHFPFAPTPTQLSHHVQTANIESDNDGLGYYADGTRRTLTDEDIAFLRNREIQQLLGKQSRPKTSSGSPNTNQRRTSIALDLVIHSNSPATTVAAAEAKDKSKKKRKKNKRHKRNSDLGGPEVEEKTYRRIARELDEQEAITVNLDY